MRYTLTLTQQHFDQLRNHLIKDDGLERPAIILCGRSLITNDLWNGGPEERLLSQELILIPDSDVIRNTEVFLQWDTKYFRAAMQKAEVKNLAICLIHNHPDSYLQFSDIDDENDLSLFKTAFIRNGGERPHASMIMTPSGEIFGRVWTKHLNSHPFDLIRVLGNSFKFLYADRSKDVNREIFDRQQRAFGKSLSNDLSKLRVAIVGCGATGSATAHLLVRLGVGQVLLIDNDLVERTNLNRLYGARASDADAGRRKVEVLRDFLAGIGIGSRIRVIHNWVGSEECREAIKSCDVVFGCTDDNSGRIFLNRFAHFYLVPVIDMGVVIDLSEDKKEIVAIEGRVTFIFPGNLCLLCRKIVDSGMAREESLRRTDPMGYERQKDEAYVRGAGDPNPMVITFTTEVGTMAVNDFLNRIVGFKKNFVSSNRMRFFDREIDVNPGGKQNPHCVICAKENYWANGDVEPFLDQTN